MSATKNVLALDLGAESGRGMLGQFDGERLSLRELHRFANGPVRTLDTLHWDVLRLYGELLNSLRLAAGAGPVDSVGVDTWGVDFALLGRDGQLLGNPRHYRDPHTENVMDDVFARMPREQLFERTGVQFMRFNTLFQLAALRRDRSSQLENAAALLFMPDLFHYWFTGIKVNEYTDASTSQMLDPHARRWADDVVQALGLPTRILGSLVMPGTVLGPLRPGIASDTGVTPAPVIASATHDTAAAVAAVPASGNSWAYISSGTWSLMGVELENPIVDERARINNFTNEGGVGGTIRFLKNIMGLWLVQECRRVWAREGSSYSYEQLARMALDSPACASLIDPDAPEFWLPPRMPAAIGEFCRRTGQNVPTEPGPVVRCALDSLALRYRWVLDRLEECTGRKLEVIHVVGGGSQNALLCQLTADACNRPVLTGPVEATAMGNVLVQAIGLGLIGSLAQAREIVRRSVQLTRYEPQQPKEWLEPYERFRKLDTDG